MKRQCGGCTLCCKLLPVRELHKGAGERCQHQRTGKGCAIYGKPAVPLSCRLWSCRWLVNDEAAGLGRPDRVHYVLDIMPDFVTVRDDLSGKTHELEVVQIWVDPKHPEAHRDPALRAYLAELGRRNIIGLVRYGEHDAFALVPPAMNGGEWHEHRRTTIAETTHTPAEIGAAIGHYMP